MTGYVAVRDLSPGDVFEMNGAAATVIVTAPHPVYRGGTLALVVWWLHAERRYSFDALAWGQMLPGSVLRGPLGPVSQDQRDRAWREALKAGDL